MTVCFIEFIYFSILSLVIGKKKFSHVKLIHSIKMHLVKQKNAMGIHDYF